MSISSSTENMAHLALTNFDVLFEIFEHLPLKELKKIRTICSDWEVPASSILAKCTHLNVKTVCDEHGGFSALEFLQLPRIKHQLLRRIKIQNTSSLEVDQNLKVYQKQFSFLETNQDFIQEIQFCVNLTFGPTIMIKTLFENLAFPILKKISIIEKSHPENFPGVGPLNLHPQGILQLAKIRELEFVTVNPYGQTVENGQYLPTFQKLISQSPNLEKLKITGNIFPDLTTASKLKSLQWTAFPLSFVAYNLKNENFNVHEIVDGIMMRKEEGSMEMLQKMLAQVNNELEELILNAISENENGERLATFLLRFTQENEYGFSKLPPFPKLKSLVINPIDGFITQLALSPNSFPLLSKLDVTMNCEPEIDLRFLLTEPRPTVTELSLTFNHCNFIYYQMSAFQCLKIMVTCYPNVKKLDFAWCGNLLNEGNDTPLDWLKELRKFLLLEDLNIRLNWCQVDLSKLMGEIAVVGFAGLKTLRLVGTTSENVVDDCCTNFFRIVFAAIPKVSFKGIHFKPSTIKILEDYQANLGKDRIQFTD